MIDGDKYEMAKTSFELAYNNGDKNGGKRGHYYVECLEKNAKSCDMLGYYFEKGKGGTINYKGARVAYQKAINLGDTDSLGSLAHLYYKGLGGEMSQVKAIKLFERSCTESSENLKYENCFNAGLAYEKGTGVRQNSFKAVELYTKACNGKHDDGCTNLGSMYYYGKGVRQDKSMAKMYFGKACDLGSDLGCTNYAKINR